MTILFFFNLFFYKAFYHVYIVSVRVIFRFIAICSVNINALLVVINVNINALLLVVFVKEFVQILLRWCFELSTLCLRIMDAVLMPLKCEALSGTASIVFVWLTTRSAVCSVTDIIKKEKILSCPISSIMAIMRSYSTNKYSRFTVLLQ